MIDESKIICDNCKNNNKSISYNKKFYFCNNCNKKLCPVCKSSHAKSFSHTLLIMMIENMNAIFILEKNITLIVMIVKLIFVHYVEMNMMSMILKIL